MFMAKEKSKFPVKLSFGAEMYDALKEATKHVSKTNMIANTSIEFDDSQKNLIIKEEVHEWYLISMGYHACRILNKVKEV